MPFGEEIFVFMRLECLGAAVALPAASLRTPLCSTLSLLASGGSCCDQAGLGEGDDDTHARYLCAAASFFLNLRISVA